VSDERAPSPSPSPARRGEQDDDDERRLLAWGVVNGQRVSSDQAEMARQLRQIATPEERLLWQAWQAHRFEGLHFRRQQVIDGFVADFYCHAARLIVEVDGPIHDDQREYDAYRDRALAHNGLRVVRVSNDDVRRNMSAVLDRIRRALTPA
jgi:very-short-patch-repair endonuclease